MRARDDSQVIIISIIYKRKLQTCIPIQIMAENEKYLKWKVDVNTFRLLGRELITDRVTAIFELVKNCYDANATNVEIAFYKAASLCPDSMISITDNGEGMTFDDIQNKWMVVGTNSKRSKKYSNPPYSRKLVGEKGVGRFAVEKLGSELVLSSKRNFESPKISIEINWDKYEEISKEHDRLDSEVDEDILENNIGRKKSYFTDIRNKYWEEFNDNDSLGTKLLISNLREIWTNEDLLRLTKELSRLISPIAEIKQDFTIYISAPEFEGFKERQLIVNKSFEFAAFKTELSYDLESGTQDVSRFRDGAIHIDKNPISIMGPVKMVLYYFDSEAKRKFKLAFVEDNLDGVKIYRDGLIATPFAESQAEDNKRRDILGLDKRKHSGFFERLGSRDILGVVEITKNLNPLIIDATSRQDFVDNKEYSELKEFIIDQIVQVEKLLKHRREVNKANTDNDLKKAKNELTNFTQVVRQTILETPLLENKLRPLLKVAKQVQIDFAKGIKAYGNLQKDKERQENLFLSLMSMQEYAAQIAHVVRISLSRVLHLGEFFKNNFPDPELDEIFKEYAQMIFEEMLSLNKAIDYMLSYALSNTDQIDINIKELLQSLLSIHYKDILERNNITSIFEMSDTVIVKANERFFLDIFENLVDNSVKALKNQEQKIIKVNARVEDDKIIILFSDNGTGIPTDIQDRVFNIFFTTTAEKGGGGVGLFVARTRIESMKGTIEIAPSEFGDVGVTFRIVLPFNTQNNA